jgi:DNA-binding transcriptional ArsR family regulator
VAGTSGAGLDIGRDIPILKHMLKQQERALDGMFQALADPSRRSMVERLSRGPATVSELARPLSMSMPAVMQHLAVLEAGGLVRSTKTGRVRSCQLTTDAFGAAEQWMNARRREWEARFDRLDALLAADREAAGPEAAHREASHREPARPEAAHPEAAHREAAHREAAHPEPAHPEKVNTND